MERIAIFAALQWECAPVLRALRRVSRQRHGNLTMWVGQRPAAEVWVVKTGIGVERAATAAQSLPRGDFDLFFSTGCAGALDPSLGPGDLAIATAMLRPQQPHILIPDFEIAHAQRAAARRSLPSASGGMLTSETVLATVESKRAAHAETGAVAVEMESAAIAACAAGAGVPFACVRAVLDPASSPLEDAGVFIDPQTGAVRPLSLARHLATCPGAFSRLLATQKLMSAARRNLEQFFAAWFDERASAHALDRR